MYTQTLAGFIASTVGALKRCESEKTLNLEWAPRHRATLKRIERNLLPSGCGIDNGTQIDTVASNEQRLVFQVPYHVMNGNGMYAGWRDVTVIVRPTFNGPDIRVHRARDESLADYLADVFRECLSQTDAHDKARGKYRAPWYHRVKE